MEKYVTLLYIYTAFRTRKRQPLHHLTISQHPKSKKKYKKYKVSYHVSIIIINVLLSFTSQGLNCFIIQAIHMNTMNMKNKEYLWFTDFKKKVPAPQQTTAMAEINISDKRDIQQRGSLHHSPLFSKISLASHHSPHASRRRCRAKKKKIKKK